MITTLIKYENSTTISFNPLNLSYNKCYQEFKAQTIINTSKRARDFETTLTKQLTCNVYDTQGRTIKEGYYYPYALFNEEGQLYKITLVPSKSKPLYCLYYTKINHLLYIKSNKTFSPFPDLKLLDNKPYKEIKSNLEGLSNSVELLSKDNTYVRSNPNVDPNGNQSELAMTNRNNIFTGDNLFSGKITIGGIEIKGVVLGKKNNTMLTTQGFVEDTVKDEINKAKDKMMPQKSLAKTLDGYIRFFTTPTTLIPKGYAVSEDGTEIANGSNGVSGIAPFEIKTTQESMVYKAYQTGYVYCAEDIPANTEITFESTGKAIAYAGAGIKTGITISEGTIDNLCKVYTYNLNTGSSDTEDNRTYIITGGNSSDSLDDGLVDSIALTQYKIDGTTYEYPGGTDVAGAGVSETNYKVWLGTDNDVHFGAISPDDSIIIATYDTDASGNITRYEPLEQFAILSTVNRLVESKNEMFTLSGDLTIATSGADLQVTWSSDIQLELPSISSGTAKYNTISAGNVILADSELAYVTVNRNSNGAILTVNVVSTAAADLAENDIILFFNKNSDIFTPHIELLHNNIARLDKINTFQEFPITPSTYPTTDYQVANKAYVDNNVIKTSITHEPTGFVNPESITVEYDSVARTITLTGTIEAYFENEQVTALTDGWTSTAHADVEGNYLLYYDGTSFNWSTTGWDFNQLLIAYVRYSITDSFSIRETHGLMPYQTHRELHNTIGTYKSSGGDLSSYTLDSTTVADRRPTISTTTLYDEDLKTINPSLTTNSYTIHSLTGTGDSNFDTAQTDIIPLSADQPYYNEYNGANWVQTLMSNNYYAAIWVLAIPTTSDTESQNYRYVFIQPQKEGKTLESIRALTPQDINLGDIEDIATEFVFINKIIIQYTASNWVIKEVKTLTGNRVTQIGSPSGYYLSTVHTDTTLIGDGTTSVPLGINLTNSNIWTADQTIDNNSLNALLIEQDGVNDNTLVVDTTNARVGINNTPTTSLDVVTGVENARIFGDGTASQGLLHLRSTTGNASILSFTEETTADLGAIGFKAGSSSMELITGGTVTSGTTALTLDNTQNALFAGNVTITGDFTVNGTTTTIDTTTLQVEDKNIEMGVVTTPTDITADGGGITLKGDTDKTLTWDNTNSNWTSSEHFNIPTGKSYKINNIDINTGGTLSNVAYLDQANTFTANQTAPTFIGNLTGNADTATALETARNIAGQSFDGTADITIASTDLTDTSNIAYLDQNNVFTGLTQEAPTFNATTSFTLNGTDINTGGTLSNLAYLDQANSFTDTQDITNSTFPVFKVIRETTNTTGTNSGLLLKTTSSGDMVDSFGGGVVYSIEDNAGVEHNIASITGVRDGADNSGAIEFYTYNTGSISKAMTIGSGGDTSFIGSVSFGASIKRKTTVFTSSATLTDLHDIVICNNSSAINITLPSASGNTGLQYTIKRKNTGNVTIGGTVDGMSNPDIDTRYGSVTVVSDGTNWNFI